MKILIAKTNDTEIKPCKEAFKENGRWKINIDDIHTFSKKHNNNVVIDFDIDEKANIIYID